MDAERREEVAAPAAGVSGFSMSEKHSPSAYTALYLSLNESRQYSQHRYQVLFRWGKFNAEYAVNAERRGSQAPCQSLASMVSTSRSPVVV